MHEMNVPNGFELDTLARSTGLMLRSVEKRSPHEPSGPRFARPKGKLRDMRDHDRPTELLLPDIASLIRATYTICLMLRSVAQQRVSKHVAASILRDAAFGGSSG
jgi:hypothetical protein